MNQPILKSIKPLLRDLLANGLLLSEISNPGKRAKGKLTIATFHRVLPENLRQQYPYPGICVTPEELRWFCSFFAHYFSVGSITNLNQRWQSGEQPNKPFLAITFDDGQLDNLQYGLPVLDEFDFKATFYIPASNIDEASILWHDRIGYCTLAARNNGEKSIRKTLELAQSFGIPANPTSAFENHIIQHSKRISPEKRKLFIAALESLLQTSYPEWGRLMTWDEIRLMHQQGHEIGSHSMTHALMPQCNDQDLKFETAESKRRLETELNTEITSFCYPNGDCDARSVEAVLQAGYQNAVTTQWGKNQLNQPHFQLNRCDVNTFNNWNRKQQLSTARFALRLSGLQPGL
ncbi:polysaccharide deacetylase family protein [Methylotenera sp.]|uniref:polysaccharide deacetylase family protein n=1 Tax=Methylotenera sp. TaxID=2051956 RepID=UPI00272F534C|nr:polysaccharide deacetylase family protein [Methylotenera sp.]MDP2231472.1 polysaccharide deacetylase family protein [Methylotenera sp.]